MCMRVGVLFFCGGYMTNGWMTKSGLGVGLAFVVGVVVFFLTMQGVRRWGGFGGEALVEAGKRQAGTVEVPVLKGADGEEEKIWKLKDQAGKVVVVNLFATWCGPCREELPELKALAKEYEGRVVFAAMSLDQDGERKGMGREAVLREFVKQEGLGYPVLVPSAESAMWKSASVPIPQTFLYDKKGRMARLVVGSIAGRDVRRSLEELLREP